MTQLAPSYILDSAKIERTFASHITSSSVTFVATQTSFFTSASLGLHLQSR
jgi:hypothetical protein